VGVAAMTNNLTASMEVCKSTTQKGKDYLNYVLTTLAIENLVPSHEAIYLCTQMSEGKINADTAVQALLRQFGINN